MEYMESVLDHFLNVFIVSLIVPPIKLICTISKDVKTNETSHS